MVCSEANEGREDTIPTQRFLHPPDEGASALDERRAIAEIAAGSGDRVAGSLTFGTPWFTWHVLPEAIVGSTCRCNSGSSHLKASSSEFETPSYAINGEPADQIPPGCSEDPKDKKRVCNLPKRKQDERKRKVDQEHKEPSPTALGREQSHLRRHAKAQVQRWQHERDRMMWF
jgi:hypothetical protein